MNDILSEFLGKKRKSNNKKENEKNENKEKVKRIKIYKKGILLNKDYYQDNESEKEDEKDEDYEPEDDEKTFKAFTGKGKIVSIVNTKGLKIDKDYKNKINKEMPYCKINIRLFNGEIANEDFNLTQTLQDIINYVRKKSGSNNFSLLDGFPPKPLTDFNKTIQELHLEGSILTQKIN